MGNASLLGRYLGSVGRNTSGTQSVKGDASSWWARPDEWGPAVASGDATKLSKLVLLWSGSKPERALSILRDCVSSLEKEVAVSTAASSPVSSPPPTTHDEWGSAVVSGDATKLAELVLMWSGSKPERALSVVRNCASLMGKEVALSTTASPLPSCPTTHGPTRNSGLDALIVAMKETCDGKSLYKSTKELQLASLELCIACRSYQTAHLTVDPHTPRRLLAAADAPPPHPNRLCGTRVPRLKARRVTWNLPTAAALRYPIYSMTDADSLKFDFLFEGSLDAVAWPRRLERIEFDYFSSFNMVIDLVEWPASLQTLDLGSNFNQPIEPIQFPPLLRTLKLGCGFNQPIDRVSWPSSLQELEFGYVFNQPIARVSWPDSLQLLAFGDYFDQSIEAVVWPPSLQQLKLGDVFNQPIEQATFPASLYQITFGGFFNQPIDGVLWPDSLQRLFFGIDFDQSIDNVRWPASLEELTFGWCDEESCNGIVMRSDFNHRIDSSVWPESLRRLTLGHKFRQSLQGLGTWMPTLETLRLFDWDHHAANDSLLRGIDWPEALRQLVVFQNSNLDGVVVPSAVEVVYAYNESATW